MIPKSKRLNKNDFTSLSRRNIIRTNLFDLGYLSSLNNKVTCIISKKTIKKAVDRNKIKRKFYNAYSENKIKTPYIIIFYPKKESLHTPYLVLKEEISKIFDRI